MQQRLRASNVAVAGDSPGAPRSHVLAFQRRDVRTFTTIALATGAVLFALSSEAIAAFAPAVDGVIRLLVPFPPTGPRDIQGLERATRTYRTISAHAPQPISELLADVAAMAVSGVPGVRVQRVRQSSSRNRVDLATYDAGFDAHRTVVLVSHDAVGAAVAGTRAAALPDIGWIAPIATMPLALLVTPALAADFGRWRHQPGSAGRLPRLGSSGERSVAHFAGTLLSHALGIRFLHVPYNGGRAALNALVAQEIDLMFAPLPLVLPYIEAGRLPVLGLASARRFELLPQLPTLAEAGMANVELEGWFASYASRAVAPALRAELSQRLRAVIASGTVRSALLVRGLQPADPDPEDFARRLVRDRERVIRLLAAGEG